MVEVLTDIKVKCAMTVRMSVTFKIYNDLLNDNDSRKDGRKEMAMLHGCTGRGLLTRLCKEAL